MKRVHFESREGKVSFLARERIPKSERSERKRKR
jgi:hypothetical protein